MIRKFQKSDTKQVMKIWLSGNEDAHPFIPKDYWRANYSIVEKQLLQAEVFVYETNGEIQGFIGIVERYIAGIFVHKEYRSLGIGKQLLEYVKQKYASLSLNVYQKNKLAVEFYYKENFSLMSTELDEATGETEYIMIWQAEQIEE